MDHLGRVAWHSDVKGFRVEALDGTKCGQEARALLFEEHRARLLANLSLFHMTEVVLRGLARCECP